VLLQIVEIEEEVVVRVEKKVTRKRKKIEDMAPITTRIDQQSLEKYTIRILLKVKETEFC
jgi:hypothetical protein